MTRDNDNVKFQKDFLFLMRFALLLVPAGLTTADAALSFSGSMSYSYELSFSTENAPSLSPTTPPPNVRSTPPSPQPVASREIRSKSVLELNQNWKVDDTNKSIPSQI